MTDWHREPLTWSHAKRFAGHMRPADRIEVQIAEQTPEGSLEAGISAGPCWAAMVGEDPIPVGVWGWTGAGAVWSFWRNLTTGESRELLRQTPRMVREMVSDAGIFGVPTLANLVWERNMPALDWLMASKCFDVELDKRIIFNGHYPFIPFSTKPLEELPSV